MLCLRRRSSLGRVVNPFRCGQCGFSALFQAVLRFGYGKDLLRGTALAVIRFGNNRRNFILPNAERHQPPEQVLNFALQAFGRAVHVQLHIEQRSSAVYGNGYRNHVAHIGLRRVPAEGGGILRAPAEAGCNIQLPVGRPVVFGFFHRYLNRTA